MDLKVHLLGLAALTAMGFAVSARAEVEFIGTPHAVEAVPSFQGSPAKKKAPRAIPFRTVDPEALARAKKRIGPPADGAMTNEITPRAISAEGKPGIPSDGTVTPPDSTGAIGPRHYIEMVNAQVGVFNRKLNQLATIDLDTFVGRPLDSQCDPQIIWDQNAGRWFYAALDCDGELKNFLLIGWSKDGNPLPLPSASGGGNWCRFQIPTGSDLDDYPKLGTSDNFIVLGTNVYPGGISFSTSRIWAFPKPANDDTSCARPKAFSFGSSASHLTKWDGTTAFTPVPANLTDGGPRAYVTAADSPFFGFSAQLMIWSIKEQNNQPGTPVLVPLGNVDVPSYTFPPNVPQPGTANVIDSSDTRLTQSVAHRDPTMGDRTAIWTQHTVASIGNRAEVRWYQLDPSRCSGGTCASGALRQSGVIANGKHFVFNAAVSPARNGKDAGIQFNLGSSTLLSQIHAKSRIGSDPLGVMGGDVRISSSIGADQDFSCTRSPPCRWGDYSALTPDPKDAFTLWGTNMGTGKPNLNVPAWTTTNFSFKTR